MKSSLGILRFALGCHHLQKSGVFTTKKRTYQVCFEVRTGIRGFMGADVSVPTSFARDPSVFPKNAPSLSDRRTEGPAI